MLFESILAQFTALVGFAAVVSVIVNILKSFGVVQDGTADKWVAGFNLVGVLTLVGLRIFLPNFDVNGADTVMQEIALFGTYILSFVSMLLASKGTYFAIKDLPIIGKSFEAEEEKECLEELPQG